MNVNSKFIAGLLLAVTLLPVAFFAKTVLASDDQLQDQDRIRLQDCSYESDKIVERRRLRIHEQTCFEDMNMAQERNRNQVHNSTCNQLQLCEQEYKGAVTQTRTKTMTGYSTGRKGNSYSNQ